MRILLAILMLCSCSAFRTLGELAHGKQNYEKLLAEVHTLPSAIDRASYIIGEKLYAAALVGTLAETESRNRRLAEFCRANSKILLNPANRNKTGRTLGIGLQPQCNYQELELAILANSDCLTPDDLKTTRATIDADIGCGAWLFTPFQPRRSSKGQGIAGHIDAFFVPDDGSPKWAMTSLIDPALSRSDQVLDRMKAAGFSRFTHTPPQNLLEQLYCDMPPNALIGNWNNILATGLDEQGRDLTFSRLAAAQAGKPEEILYDTFLICKIWLPPGQYRRACRIRELQELSKDKGGRPLTLGTHSGINSCAQFTECFFPFAQSSCSNIQGVFENAIAASTECWINDGEKNREIFDFLEGNHEGFEKIYRKAAHEALTEYFKEPTLAKARDPSRASYLENYNTCTARHPNPDACDFYEIAADTALELLKNKNLD